MNFLHAGQMVTKKYIFLTSTKNGLLNNNAERKGLWMQNLVWSCIESGKRKTASLRLEEVEYNCVYFIIPVVWKMEKSIIIVNIYT